MKIGFTTSFPVEIIFAAGYIPVDLNNIFITGEPSLNVKNVENEGFPRNICSWIKGIYDVVLKNEIRTVIGVVQGDCSNTHSLMSLFKDKGVNVIPFSFPYNRDKDKLRNEIANLAYSFNVTGQQIYEVKRELDQIRKMLIELDVLTYGEQKVSGKENHYWQVNASDFFGEPERYKRELQAFIEEAKEREPRKKKIRLAYIGVPPIFTDFYDFFDDTEADIVFNEVQRQFAMPSLKDDIVEQYYEFTYPYSVFERLRDIKEEVNKRKITGIISYSQAFCHRQIDNILLKKYLPYSYLTIEGDVPAGLDERTKLRLESFLDVIRFSGNL